MRGLVALLFLTLPGCVHEVPERDCMADLGGMAPWVPALDDPFAAADRLLEALDDPRAGAWGRTTLTEAGAHISVDVDRNFIAYRIDGQEPWNDMHGTLRTAMDAVGLPEARTWHATPYADGRMVRASHAVGDGVGSADPFPEEAIEQAFLRWFTLGNEVRHELILDFWSVAEPGEAVVDAHAAEAGLRAYLGCARPGLDVVDVSLGVHPNGEAPLYAIREQGWGHWFWVMGPDCGGSFVVDARTGQVIHADPDGC